MSKKSFQTEHKRLIKVLKGGSKKERNKEADEQETELEEKTEGTKHEKREKLFEQIKMVDAGKKFSDSLGMTIQKTNKEKYYPNLYLDGKYEFLKDKKVGETCKLLIEAEVTSMSQRQTSNGVDENSYTLEIKKIGSAY